MITIEQLFNEDFKPLWLQKQEQYKRESFIYATQAKIDLEFRLAGYKKLRTIALKYKHKYVIKY